MCPLVWEENCKQEVMEVDCDAVHKDRQDWSMCAHTSIILYSSHDTPSVWCVPIPHPCHLFAHFFSKRFFDFSRKQTCHFGIIAGTQKRLLESAEEAKKNKPLIDMMRKTRFFAPFNSTKWQKTEDELRHIGMSSTNIITQMWDGKQSGIDLLYSPDKSTYQIPSTDIVQHSSE